MSAALATATRLQRTRTELAGRRFNGRNFDFGFPSKSRRRSSFLLPHQKIILDAHPPAAVDDDAQIRCKIVSSSVGAAVKVGAYTFPEQLDTPSEVQPCVRVIHYNHRMRASSHPQSVHTQRRSLVCFVDWIASGVNQTMCIFNSGFRGILNPRIPHCWLISWGRCPRNWSCSHHR